MNLELEGVLQEVLPKQSGQSARGTWVKQDFIVKTQDDYPKDVCFTMWGDKIDQLASLQNGMKLKVNFDVESREYNGRWYTNLKAWKISQAQSGTTNTPPPPGEPMSENDAPPPPDMPF